MTSSRVSPPPSDPARPGGRERAWTAAVADQFRGGGWAVTVDPAPEQLPTGLRDLHPDMIAQRGDEHLVVEIRGLRRAGDGPEPAAKDPLASIAARVAEMPGWQLEVVWTGQDEPPASAYVLADRARRAADLVDVDAEAALLLAWSALEGVLAAQAGQVGVRAQVGTNLAAELFSRGLLDDATYALVRDAQRLRTQVAHGRSAHVDHSLVHRIVNLASSATPAARSCLAGRGGPRQARLRP